MSPAGSRHAAERVSIDVDWFRAHLLYLPASLTPVLVRPPREVGTVTHAESA